MQKADWKMQDVFQVSGVQHFPLGTRLVRGQTYRYGQAGSHLKAHHPAYAATATPLRNFLNSNTPTEEKAAHPELFWSDLRAEGDETLIVGWPTVDVAPGQYFWVLELV